MNKFIIAGIIVLLLGIGTAFYFQKTETLPTELAKRTQQAIRECNHEPIKEQTEGPYYKSGSPRTNELYNESITGEKVVLSGYVLNTDCTPVANAWIDFWQANGNGEYDNNGYTLRGHQYTDTDGKFFLVTVIPGEYPGRTPHIHFKIRANDSSPIITSQLYLPDSKTNESDAIFDQGLVMNVIREENKVFATYNIIINK